MSGSQRPAVLAREHLVAEHSPTISGILRVADAVAADWPVLADGRRATTDRDAVVPPLDAGLERTGLLSQLPTILVDAVDAAGYSLTAPPVAAPPYVAVTSTGPLLRATVGDGRLVVAIDCFEVVRECEFAEHSSGPDAGPVCYARTASDPATALSVEFHGTGE